MRCATRIIVNLLVQKLLTLRMLMKLTPEYQESISSTFYEQLLNTQIPNSLSRRKKRKKTFLFASFHEPILYKKLSFFKEIVINYLKVLSYKRIMYILARNLEHHRSSLSDTNCSIRLPPTVNKT